MEKKLFSGLTLPVKVCPFTYVLTGLKLLAVSRCIRLSRATSFCRLTSRPGPNGPRHRSLTIEINVNKDVRTSEFVHDNVLFREGAVAG